MIQDTVNFKTSEPPVSRVTNFKHEDFDRFLDYLEMMPEAKGFKIAPTTEEEPDGGVHISFELSGKGSELLGRLICRVTVWFITDPVSEENVIGIKLLQKLTTLWGTMNLDKNLRERGFELQSGIISAGYKRKSGQSPTRYGFTFKYYSEKQKEYEEEMKKKLEADAQRKRYNDIADAVKEDDRVKVQIERLVKRLKK